MRKNNKYQNTGMVYRIRRAAANAIAPFCRADIFDRAEILVKDRPGFNRSWNDLRKTGELKKLGYQKYRYDPRLLPTADVKKRIYRAMHVKGAFSASDISKLTEAHISYAQSTIRKLTKAGWLELTGKKGRVKFYRVRNANTFYTNFVRSKP